MRNAELIFIPTPSVGHLVPLLEFARRLIDQDDRIRITIILMKLQGQSHMDTYVKSIASSQPFVRFIDVPELDTCYSVYWSLCIWYCRENYPSCEKYSHGYLIFSCTGWSYRQGNRCWFFLSPHDWSCKRCKSSFLCVLDDECRVPSYDAVSSR